jgi:hypothetical protein
MKITLTYVSTPGGAGKKFHYKTLGGARKKASRLVGGFPKFDPDGYAVSRARGDCLFVTGDATLEDIFPGITSGVDKAGHGLGYMQGRGAS